MAEQRMMNADEIVEYLSDVFPDDDIIDEDFVRVHLNELVDVCPPLLTRGYHDDDCLYSTHPGVNWSNIHMIDNKYKKTFYFFLSKTLPHSLFCNRRNPGK